MSEPASRASLVLALLAATAAATDPWDVAVRTCTPRIPAPLQRHGQFGCPALLDEQTARDHPERVTPWTHPPVCANATLLPDKDRHKQYCVYTNALHGIEGLSLIAMPEVAATSMDLLDEIPYPHPRLLQAKNATGTEPPPSWEVVDIPGRGKGVVATRKIAQYEEIFVDYAAVVVDLYFPGEVSGNDGYRLLDQAAGQLSRPERVRGLAQSIKAARNPIENVLRSNAFHTELAGRNHMALFPDLSRMNHNCQPNAFPRFPPRSLAVSVAASKEIQPGEEITISYINVGQTREERQKSLLRWEFVCSCPLCTAEPAVVEASDARRRRIEQLRDAAITHFTAGEAVKALNATSQLYPLLREEELFPLYAEQLENLARIFYVMGRREEAEFYAQKSLDTLAEQGYIAEDQRQQVHVLLRNFEKGA